MLDRDSQTTRREEAGRVSGFKSNKTGTAYTPRPLSPPRSSVRPGQTGGSLTYTPSPADAGDFVASTPAWTWQTWASRVWGRLMADPAIAFALTIFMTHRLLLFALGALLAPIAPIEPPLGYSLLRDVDPRHWGPAFFLLGPWQRWDTNWYIHIAHWGYSIGDGSTNYPPLYPLAMGFLGRILLDQYMLAGIIISNLAYIVALVYFYRLAERLFPLEAVRRGVLFLATFPTAFFLASAYTESLYLALTLMAFYYAEQKRWLLVAGVLALASITRLQGLVLWVPLAYMYMAQRNWNFRKIGRDGLLLLCAPLTLGLYVAWVYIFLNDFNFNNHLQEIWHVRFAMPWESFLGGLAGFFDFSQSRNLFYNALDLILLVTFICLLIVWLQKGLPVAYFIYSALTIGVFLTRQGTEGFFWMSMNRYLLSVFPVFMLAGQIAPRFLIKFGAGLQAVWAALFVFWMWAG